jgi:hypothetical protein
MAAHFMYASEENAVGEGQGGLVGSPVHPAQGITILCQWSESRKNRPLRSPRRFPIRVRATHSSTARHLRNSALPRQTERC